MQEIQNMIQNNLSIKRKNKQNNQNSVPQIQEQDKKQCNLCLKQYSHSNHPTKICTNDHILCNDCVAHKLYKQTKMVKNNQNQTIYSCPFCQTIIDFNTLVTDYKTLNYINLTKHNNSPTKKEISLLEKLSQQNFLIIFKFIQQRDKINLCSTNLFLRSILMDGKIWGSFVISDTIHMNQNSKLYQRNWKLRLTWVCKYFTVIKPNQLKIVVMNFYEDQKLIYFFLNKNYFWVKNVSLYCESMEVHLALAKACKQVTSLNVSSSVFSDVLFEQMTKYMKSIKDFSVIKDDCNFCGQKLSKRFESGLQSIILKSHMIDFQQIALIAKNNSESLKQVQLDVQQCSQQTLVTILQNIPNIQILRLFHMENIHIPEKLSQTLSSNVRQLYLTKTYQMPMTLIINRIASPKLSTIDFTQVNMLNDEDIQNIAKSCPYLKRINISWSPKINENSIILLINSCLMLQYLNLTGLKNLTDKTFQQYNEIIPSFNQKKYQQVRFDIRQNRHTYKHSHQSSNEQQLQKLDHKLEYFFHLDLDQNLFSQQGTNSPTEDIFKKIDKIKTLKCLKELNCVSCNNISDKMLRLIYTINRKVHVINYYGNDLGLYAIDQLEDDTW